MSKANQIYFDNYDPDVRAYIYQAIQDFEPYLLPQTSVGVLIQENKKSNKACEKYRVDFVLQTGSGAIQGSGFEENIFAAARTAKEQLMEQITAIHEAIVSPEEREQEIRSAVQKAKLH